jgi:hypothetical protein
VIVAVAVPSGRVPAWHGWCIAALRQQPELIVRVVATGAQRPWAPPWLAARLAGKALVPVDVALDAAGTTGADLIVDLTGDAASLSAPHGVWSFRLGQANDAVMPFAREIADGRNTCDVVLERRSHAGREILRTGTFAITRWHPVTVRLALAEAARWPATLAAAVAAGTQPPGRLADPPERAPLSALDGMRFGVSLGRRLASAVVTALIHVNEWNVGFVEGGARRLLSPEPLAVRWLPQPDALTFIADPFVAERDGVRALFVEAFDYDQERGTIDALVLDDDDNVVRRERVLDLPTHLSYPYPVEIDGELYLVPENCEGNEVALYRCVQFPNRWEREVAIFPGYDGVDTTMFQHEGRWWAFCTRYSRGSTLALNAFYANSPRGPWSPHALNPVVVDVSSARPAGQPFVVDGVLYRPGQDCSESYGGGLAIARIDVLTPTAYEEHVVQRHGAHGFGRWNQGIHTVSFTRDRVVVDGKHVYSDLRRLPGAAKKIASVARRLVTRRRPKKEATFA